MELCGWPVRWARHAGPREGSTRPHQSLSQAKEARTESRAEAPSDSRNSEAAEPERVEPGGLRAAAHVR